MGGNLIEKLAFPVQGSPAIDQLGLFERALAVRDAV